MQRELVSIRVQPAYKRALEMTAERLQRTTGWIIEHALYEHLPDIPRNCMPGVSYKQMKKQEVNDV